MDIIDSRELQERMDEIQYDLETLEMPDTEREDLRTELVSLQALKEEVEGYASDDWRDGIQLIAEQDFTEYCQDLLEDCGEIPRDLPSYVVVDWEATAENLRVDYSEVDHEGTTYLFRI
jgi:antirestriction protein